MDSPGPGEATISSWNYPSFRESWPLAGIILLLAGALLILSSGLKIPVEAMIGAGFVLFFVSPGMLFCVIMLARKRLTLLEYVPISIALSMGVWAFPGMAAYYLEWSLRTVIVFELSIIAVLLGLAMVRLVSSKGASGPGGQTYPWSYGAVILTAVALFVLAAWTGAFRGVGLDWDYFNYISAIKKLVVWDQASIAHFAYKDAPPDPIHSYNIWALQWAIIAKLFHLDPITLYARSALFTIPAAALSVYALARRLFSPDVARTAFFMYVCYHVIYGGLLFLGRTTFYPADTQWLVVFPACVVLYKLFEKEGKGKLWLLAGVALSVLGMSMVHVLWGLCFYLTIGSYALILLLKRLGVARAISAAWRDGKAKYIGAMILLAGLPFLAVIVDCIVMARTPNPDGATPLLGIGWAFPPRVYAAVFVMVPALYFAWLAYKYRGPWQGGDDPLTPAIIRAVLAIATCLVVAIPYIILRSQAIEATDWSAFGRNPYRAFITPTLFILNPFQRSLGNPNMTFYPLYIAGYLCLPALWFTGRKERGYLLALAALVLVPLICFHPVFATLFTGFFSLGYLRRLLRLAAIFSFFPAALVVNGAAGRIFNEESRPLLNISLSFIVCALIGAACILFSAKPVYYNRMLKKTIVITQGSSKDSLIYDDTPYRLLERGGWFGPDDVIFSDMWTSYRLTAYLPQFVAVQQKPGTGVADQDERRRLELEFFDSRTGLPEMREILDSFQATGVVINRNPGYKIYNLPLAHPEAVGKIKKDPKHFELLLDQGDWVIFKYLKQNAEDEQ